MNNYIYITLVNKLSEIPPKDNNLHKKKQFTANSINDAESCLESIRDVWRVARFVGDWQWPVRKFHGHGIVFSLELHAKL